MEGLKLYPEGMKGAETEQFWRPKAWGLCSSGGHTEIVTRHSCGEAALLDIRDGDRMERLVPVLCHLMVLGGSHS